MKIDKGFWAQLSLVAALGVSGVAAAKTYGQLDREYRLEASGGTGGGRNFDTCPQDEVVVGIAGGASWLIHSLQFVCARINNDGSWTETRLTSLRGSVKGDAFLRRCPQGQAAVGYSGRSGSRIDAISLDCRDIRSWVERRAEEPTSSATQLVGGTGGNLRSNPRLRCAPPFFMKSAFSQSGVDLDRIEPICTGFHSVRSLDVNNDALPAHDLPIWRVKMAGTHNSYMETDRRVANRPDTAGPDHALGLSGQLGAGVRVLEIDVVSENGAVSHGGDILDDRHCSNIRSCLSQVKSWSDSNPDHSPIVLFVEFSDNVLIPGKPNRREMSRTISAAWSDLIPRSRVITKYDAFTPISELRQKIALVYYRKRSSDPGLWQELKSPSDFHGYLSEHQIFVAGKSVTDIDFVGEQNSRALRFVKYDTIPAMDTASGTSFSRTWANRSVFFATSPCEANECDSPTDKSRVLLWGGQSLANSLMLNDLGRGLNWLGYPLAYSNRADFLRALAPQDHRLGPRVRLEHEIFVVATDSTGIPRWSLGEREAFRWTPGLTDLDCASFRSTRRPGYYLGFSDQYGRNLEFESSSQMHSNATFCGWFNNPIDVQVGVPMYLQSRGLAKWVGFEYGTGRLMVSTRVAPFPGNFLLLPVSLRSVD